MKYRGVIVGAASGAMGAMVASHNKGGQYLRARVVPAGGVPTVLQEVVRNAVRSLTSRWQTLTQVQRDAWALYATNVFTIDALGQSIQLSGFNWFVGSNTIRSQAGEAIVASGPTIFDRGAIDLSSAEFTAGASSGTLSLGHTMSQTGLTALDLIVVYEGRDFSPGRSKYFGSFQLNNAFNGSTASSATTLVLGSLVFPHSASNSKSFNVVVIRGDGRYTTPSRFTVSP